MSTNIDPYLMIQSFVDGETSPEEEANLLSTFKDQPGLKEVFESLKEFKIKLGEVGEFSPSCPIEHTEYFNSIAAEFISQASLEDISEEDLILLQSYVDGELADHDTQRVKSLISSDSNALAFVLSLKGQKNILSSLEETSMRCPEDPDFYWSQISQQIESESNRLSVDEEDIFENGFGALLKWLSNPLAAPALVVFILCLFIGGQLNNATIYQEVQVSSAYVDSSSEIAVYFVDDPTFLTSSAY